MLNNFPSSGSIVTNVVTADNQSTIRYSDGTSVLVPYSTNLPEISDKVDYIWLRKLDSGLMRFIIKHKSPCFFEFKGTHEEIISNSCGGHDTWVAGNAA